MSWKRREGRGGGERFSSVDERRLDAGFFQQGHGRMDVGIMEASTVPSLPDKNCRWKEDGGEGDEGRISRRGGGRGRGRGKEEQRREWEKEGEAEGDRARGRKRGEERKQRRGGPRSLERLDARRRVSIRVIEHGRSN